MDIDLIKKVESSLGEIFIVDSNQIGINRVEYETKKDFQRAVVNKVLNNTIGSHHLKHLENGAPYLENSPFKISISHCNNLFAVYLSTKEDIGVDIEIIKKDLNKGKAYFLNEKEINIDWNLKELYLIWCAKEAIFKLQRGRINDLANEVSILGFEKNQISYSFEYEVKKLHYLFIDSWALVYT